MVVDVMRQALSRCQAVLEAWRGLGIEDFSFAEPKGFSSFTMGIRCNREGLEPRAALYRHLATKDNAILNFDNEKAVFLALSEAGIAPQCYAYDTTCRIEAF